MQCDGPNNVYELESIINEDVWEVAMLPIVNIIKTYYTSLQSSEICAYMHDI